MEEKVYFAGSIRGGREDAAVYKRIIDYINGIISLDEANYRIKLNSRHYAKRQFTWFKADKEYQWFNLDRISEQEIVKSIYTMFNIKA